MSLRAKLTLACSLCIHFAVIVPSTAQEMRAYCRQVGIDDVLRAVQPDMLADARVLFGMEPNAPDGLIVQSTVVRCMDGEVWMCNRGANIVCGKADVSRSSFGATAFCRQNPGASFVPMAATGHATIYSWRCSGSAAVIDKQFDRADARGFLSGAWKRLRR